MKNLSNLLTTITLLAVLTVSVSTAKAGILMSDLKNGDAPACAETKNDTTKVNNGILVTFTGILVTFTGILVTFSDGSQVDCGILITD
jgi:hypothetical protein